MRTRAYHCTAGPLSVRISLDLISNLGLAALEALKSVPRRGLEIGGLLRGKRVEQDGQTTLRIEGFEPVESAHESGPSYKLSEGDLRNFDQALRACADCVGIYRTQTRSENLLLHEDDAVLFHRYFEGDAGIFLLIRPARSQAEIFVPKAGSLEAAHTFPFRVWDLAEGPEEAPEALPPAAPVRTALPEWAPAAAVPGLMPGSIRSRHRGGWRVWGAIGAVCLLATALVAARLWSRRPEDAATVTKAAESGTVGLRVAHDGRELRFQWDQDSSTIQLATHANLNIIDGNHETKLILSPPELRSGLLSYWPDTADVQVRLEVFTGGQTVSQSVRAIDGAPDTPENAAPPGPVIQSRRESTGAADRSAESDERSSLAAAYDVPKRDRAPVRPKVVPQPVMRTDVTVAAEPVDGSRQRRILSRIPLLRKLKKQPQLYVPPAPIHRVTPSVAGRRWSLSEQELPVDVKVYVSESGRVQRAELLSGDVGGYRDLANLALASARRWDFAPARLGGDKVSGEVVLHFHFSPRPASR